MIIYFSNTPLFILDHTPQARYFGLMVLKSNLPQNDPPTKYFPKVQLSISYIKKKSMLFGPTHTIFPKSAFQYMITFQYHSSFWTTHTTLGILVYMTDPPTKYLPKVYFGIACILVFFTTHPPQRYIIRASFQYPGPPRLKP